MMMIFLTRSFPIFSIPFSQESLELGLDSDSRNSFDLSIVHEQLEKKDDDNQSDHNDDNDELVKIWSFDLRSVS